MIDEKLTHLVKDFVHENSIDELQDYLAEQGYEFENEDEWKAMLRPIIREMGVPENMIEETINETFEN